MARESGWIGLVLSELIKWLYAHPVQMSALSLFAYHAGAAFVGSLEMPDENSGKFYRFFFRFVNRLAANYQRAGAAK